MFMANWKKQNNGMASHCLYIFVVCSLLFLDLLTGVSIEWQKAGMVHPCNLFQYLSYRGATIPVHDSIWLLILRPQSGWEMNFLNCEHLPTTNGRIFTFTSQSIVNYYCDWKLPAATRHVPDAASRRRRQLKLKTHFDWFSISHWNCDTEKDAKSSKMTKTSKAIERILDLSRIL